MKKITTLLIAALTALICSSCGASEDTKTAEHTVITAKTEETSSVESEASENDSYEKETDASENTVELDLSDSDNPQVSRVTLTGNIGREASLRNMYNIDIISSGVVGLFGCPIEVDYKGVNAHITFEIDESKAENVPLENLIVLWYNTEECDFQQIEGSLSGNMVTAEISNSGTYMLADKYLWYSAWGADMSEYAYAVTFKCEDLGFEIDLPTGVSYNEVSSLWEEEVLSGMMKKILFHQNSFDKSDYKITINAMRYPNEEDDCTDPASMIPLDEMTDMICDNLSGSGLTLEPKETLELSGGRKGYIVRSHYSDQTMVAGYFEYTEDTYVSINFNIESSDEQLFENAVNSMRSFKYTDK